MSEMQLALLKNGEKIYVSSKRNPGERISYVNEFEKFDSSEIVEILDATAEPLANSVETEQTQQSPAEFEQHGDL